KLAGPGFQCMEVVMSHKVDSLILTFFPIRQSAITGVAGNFRAFVWIEAPAKLPGCGVKSDDTKLGSGGEEDRMDNDRIALHFRVREGIACVISPGGFECVDIAAVDLVKGGVVNIIRATAISLPVAIICLQNSSLRTRREWREQRQ